MKLFEGKSKEEKTKLIAAIALGALALLAVGYNLIGFFPSKKATTTTTATQTPTPGKPSGGDSVVSALPSREEADLIYSSIPVVYPIVTLGAPDAGRNIFAFYEPPIKTPWSPTPFVPTPEIIKTPPPTPEPPLKIFGFSPVSVFAGAGAFDLVVTGNAFTPESRIFFNGTEMPTTFLGPDRLQTNVPANFIAGSGQRQIMVRTPDGKLYSDAAFFNVDNPPRPQLQYVGIVAPKLGNNATAYLQEGTATPMAKRLDDRVGVCTGDATPGCFRIVSISRERVIVQDVKLGFRYNIDMVKPSSGGTGSSPSNPSNPNNPFPTNPFPTNPTNPVPNATPCVPGIPCNMPVFVPNRIPTDPKKDVDDNDDGDN